MTAEVELINIVLFAILVATAIGITRLRGLYGAVMLAALFSLVIACLFVLLDAVDVAFTEAAVGAGISTVLMLTVLALTRAREAVTPRRRLWPAGIGSVLAGGMLIYASQDLPAFGRPDTPVQTPPGDRDLPPGLPGRDRCAEHGDGGAGELPRLRHVG